MCAGACRPNISRLVERLARYPLVATGMPKFEKAQKWPGTCVQGDNRRACIIDFTGQLGWDSAQYPLNLLMFRLYNSLNEEFIEPLATRGHELLFGSLSRVDSTRGASTRRLRHGSAARYTAVYSATTAPSTEQSRYILHTYAHISIFAFPRYDRFLTSLIAFRHFGYFASEISNSKYLQTAPTARGSQSD
jgi:hypothetical protein